MNKRLLIAALSVASLALVACNKHEDKPAIKHDDKATVHEVHWGYEGEGAPDKWGNLKPEYATCKDGKQQSPIDIQSATVKEKAEPIVFDYKGVAENITNNGHTIQVNMGKGSTITVAGKSYELLQFHFHAPSEHTLDGKAADMVAHLVHKSADGQLGVIGVLMNKGTTTNPALTKIWASLPAKVGDSTPLTAASLNASELLPAKRGYYNYAGSLTTPPCTEGVNWMLLKTAVDVSAEQVAAFNAIVSKSVRPVQPLNGRMIKVAE